MRIPIKDDTTSNASNADSLTTNNTLSSTSKITLKRVNGLIYFERANKSTGQKVTALIDTEVKNNYISSKNIRNDQLIHLSKLMSIKTVHGESKISSYVKVDVFGHKLIFFVIDNTGNFDLIFGMDGLQRINAEINFSTFEMSYTSQAKGIDHLTNAIGVNDTTDHQAKSTTKGAFPETNKTTNGNELIIEREIHQTNEHPIDQMITKIEVTLNSMQSTQNKINNLLEPNENREPAEENNRDSLTVDVTPKTTHLVKSGHTMENAVEPVTKIPKISSNATIDARFDEKNPDETNEVSYTLRTKYLKWLKWKRTKMKSQKYSHLLKLTIEDDIKQKSTDIHCRSQQFLDIR